MLHPEPPFPVKDVQTVRAWAEDVVCFPTAKDPAREQQQFEDAIQMAPKLLESWRSASPAHATELSSGMVNEHLFSSTALGLARRVAAEELFFDEAVSYVALIVRFAKSCGQAFTPEELFGGFGTVTRPDVVTRFMSGYLHEGAPVIGWFCEGERLRAGRGWCGLQLLSALPTSP